MIEIFPDARSQAAAAASAIHDRLTYRLRLKGEASLVVTGGRSPGEAYDMLSGAPLDWAKIDVTLSDERFVDTDSPDSNERLVRERLLQCRAARARFTGLRGAAATPQQAAADAAAALSGWGPFEVVMLGMGEDGHIASLFPGSPDLAKGMARTSPPCLAIAQGEGAPPEQPRLSLSLPRLASSRLVIILASGSKKRRVLEQAEEGGDPMTLPLRGILQSAPSVRILWTA